MAFDGLGQCGKRVFLGLILAEGITLAAVVVWNSTAAPVAFAAAVAAVGTPIVAVGLAIAGLLALACISGITNCIISSRDE